MTPGVRHGRKVVADPVFTPGRVVNVRFPDWTRRRATVAYLVSPQLAVVKAGSPDQDGPLWFVPTVLLEVADGAL